VIGILCAGGGAIDAGSGNTFLLGNAGSGGPSAGNPGENGIAAEEQGCL
jgi:hypothetical protein